ncbi:acyl-CoA thioesterase [Oceanobacillus bengalensis]|uniref:Acyl-CoA thioesterase n=1 Tax=Oceanobacillus bengalensis TaxID=1435466 RepID=A0A494Z0S8_9BACI|nr:acyl-CoA thioesterase [Oceanobacillus bengalensis]RKQ15888.1 acyl-CoA thioesterase [Oceanobacillus bengalensis]
MEAKPCSNSRVINSTLVLPPDTNNHGTLFGGKLLSHIDVAASIAAIKHARKLVVTASTDSVDFLAPVTVGQTIHIEAYVTWTRNTSMEVFVKVLTENLMTAETTICSTAFLTFVAIDENGKPSQVPEIYPETEQERRLHESAKERAAQRREQRRKSKAFAEELEI